MSEDKPLPEPAAEPSETRETLDTVLRRTAKSGKVSYADPVILHETSRSRVSFIPYFIPHSDHTELAGAIVTEQKAPPPMDFVVVAKKSLSLQGPAARRLLQTLKTHLKVAESDEDGEFILIQAAEGTANLSAHDPALVARANPVPGDKVVGFITRGRGVTIHTVDCQNAMDDDPHRKVEVEWDSTKEYSYPVRILIYAQDKKGLLGDISNSISSHGANIKNARVDTTEDKKAISTFEIEIRDLNHLNKVIRALEKIKGVYRVERMRVETQTGSLTDCMAHRAKHRA